MNDVKQIAVRVSVAALLVLSITLVGAVVHRGPSAAAGPAAAPSLNFYLGAPNVENTDVVGADVMTFNSASVGACPSTWQADGGTAIGTITGTGCTVAAASPYGGAIAGADGNPVIRQTGTGTNSASVPSGGSVTLTLAAARNYVGFWWSAGDPNNTLTLYSGGTGGTVVGTFTTAKIVQFLNNGSGSISSIGGTSYQTCNYWGNPRLTPSPCPGIGTSLEPFAYIHLFGVNGLQFDTIRFSQGGGGGFEFDNLAVATTSTAPSNALIGLPPAIRATDSSQNATTCTSFSSNLGWVESNFATAPTYSVNPSLPTGLSLDTASGEVSGTPTAPSSSATYTMTAAGGGPSATATFTLVVTDGGNLPCGGTPPGQPGTPTITPTEDGLVITVAPPTTGGTPESYLVTTEPGGRSCTVTGVAGTCTITGLSSAQGYSVTVVASNEAGVSPPREVSGPFFPSAPAGGRLPETGAPWLMLGIIGVELVAIGAVVSALPRRRIRRH